MKMDLLSISIFVGKHALKIVIIVVSVAIGLNAWSIIRASNLEGKIEKYQTERDEAINRADSLEAVDGQLVLQVQSLERAIDYRDKNLVERDERIKGLLSRIKSVDQVNIDVKQLVGQYKDKSDEELDRIITDLFADSQ